MAWVSLQKAFRVSYTWQSPNFTFRRFRSNRNLAITVDLLMYWTGYLASYSVCVSCSIRAEALLRSGVVQRPLPRLVRALNHNLSSSGESLERTTIVLLKGLERTNVPACFWRESIRLKMLHMNTIKSSTIYWENASPPSLTGGKNASPLTTWMTERKSQRNYYVVLKEALDNNSSKEVLIEGVSLNAPILHLYHWFLYRVSCFLIAH